MKAIIKDKKTGKIYEAEIYHSFVYLTDQGRIIPKEDYEDFFEFVKYIE